MGPPDACFRDVPRRALRPLATWAGAIRTRPAASAEPIPRAGPPAPGAVGRIGQLAAVDRQASAANAFGQPGPQALELGDPLVDPLLPLARQTCPVATGGYAVGGKLGELLADVPERQADFLGKNDEGDPAQDRPWIAAVAGARPLRRNEAALLVEAKRRGGDAAAPRSVMNARRLMCSP